MWISWLSTHRKRVYPVFPMDKSRTDKLHAEFERTLWTLMENHWTLTLETRKWRNTEWLTKAFQVGMSEYKTVVLPPMLNLRKNTLMLLKDFIAQGDRYLCLKITHHMLTG